MDRTSENLRDAIERGVKRKAALLREAGGGLSVSEAAKLLGISTEELKGRGSVLRISMDNGEAVWPAFQFESRAMTNAVGEVLAAVNVIETLDAAGLLFPCVG